MAEYWTATKRGMIRRCPKCGDGHIFTGYINLRDECPVCHESFRNVRTDDAAPWATVLVVGHFAAGLIASLINTDISSNALTAIGVTFVLVAATAILPVMKGIFVNINWVIGLR